MENTVPDTGAQNAAPQRRRPRRMLAFAIAGAGITGLLAGALGGAAGAFWVLETVGTPKITPAARNAVLAYDDMPEAGMRPVDIAGLRRNGTPLNPCVISFLNEQEALIGKADWQSVRFHPEFRNDDIINEVAFGRGVLGITRQNDIYIAVPKDPAQLNQLNERLFFHELAHVAQYASGLDIGDYAASAAASYANGSEPQKNFFEEEVRAKEQALLDAWYASDQRRACHPDLGEDMSRRAESERPEVQYAFFDTDKGEYVIVKHRLHVGKGFALPTNPSPRSQPPLDPQDEATGSE
ncbi:DUF4157 domain-containing protein [Croceicoccus sp. Ery5]|uniref:DUF4157 domain-containing protein n=1 Tax=Croceicoccus sp. Ery5 TaxID=1703340 RepID=UPI001E450E3B|nr:DUF4157 domain-containing protein [Croceicoccus sp. Ery5]